MGTNTLSISNSGDKKKGFPWGLVIFVLLLLLLALAAVSGDGLMQSESMVVQKELKFTVAGVNVNFKCLSGDDTSDYQSYWTLEIGSFGSNSPGSMSCTRLEGFAAENGDVPRSLRRFVEGVLKSSGEKINFEEIITKLLVHLVQ